MSETPVPSLLGKIAGYTEILAKDPRSTIFVQLSETYRQMGMLGDALEIALNGVRTHPTFAPGYTVLGRVRAQQEASEEAIAAFEKAVELDDRNLAAIKGLVSLRLKAGEGEKARQLLLRASEINPDDAMVQKTLKRLSAAPPAPPRPAGGTTPSRTPSPSPPPPKKGAPISTPTIAEIYIKQGFPKRAMKVYRDLLEVDPHNEEVRRKLIALKKRIAAAEQEASQEEARSGSVAPQKGRAATEPAEPAAESATYARKLEDWLTAIQKGREHVR